jgi:hypothetical protein
MCTVRGNMRFQIKIKTILKMGMQKLILRLMDTYTDKATEAFF